MKCKYIFLTSYIAAFFLLMFKVYVAFRLVNPKTGMFYSHSFETLFYYILAFFILILLTSSLFLRRCPLKAPSVKLPQFITSILLLLAMTMSIVFDEIPNIASDQYVIKILTFVSVVFACFLLTYLLTYIFNFGVNPVFYCIPLIFWLVKIIAEYVTTAKMPFIMENGYKTIATAFVAFFFLYFAKYHSRVISKNSHKTIMFVGFTSTALCESFALPRLAYYFKNGYVKVNNVTVIRNSVYELILYAATGLFILVFLHSFFSNHNLARHTHHSQTKNILPIDDDVPTKPFSPDMNNNEENTENTENTENKE